MEEEESNKKRIENMLKRKKQERRKNSMKIRIKIKMNKQMGVKETDGGKENKYIC